jgi:hypothetical protein
MPGIPAQARGTGRRMAAKCKTTLVYTASSGQPTLHSEILSPKLEKEKGRKPKKMKTRFLSMVSYYNPKHMGDRSRNINY